MWGCSRYVFLVILPLIALVCAQASNTTLTWTPCGPFRKSIESVINQTTCYFFQVPLDWHNPSVGNAQLVVSKLNATNSRKGSLFIIPGGPGEGGLSLVGEDFERLVNVTGGSYDIITWNPRGAAYSTPTTFNESYNTFEDYNEYWNGTLGINGIDYTGNFTDQGDVDRFYGQADVIEQKFKEVYQSFLQQYGDTMKYVGSVASARDLLALADTFDTPGQPVNFWAFSYGTVIGSYFANLFPERVGRIVLDGIVDVIDIAEKPPYTTLAHQWESSDEAFGAVANACAAAGPSQCGLTKAGWSGADVVAYAQSALKFAHDYLKSHPEDSLTGTPGYPLSASLRVIYLSISYFGSNFIQSMNELGIELQALAEVSGGQFVYPPGGGDPPILRPRQDSSNSNPTIRFARSDTVIACGDSVDADPSVSMRDVFDQTINVTRNVSPLFGGTWGRSEYYCPFWTSRAVERYTGPFNRSLASPALLIGNKADPITPFIGAQRIANTMGSNGVLVQLNTFGHTSLVAQSTCMSSIIRNHLIGGELPSNNGIICDVDSSFEVLPGVSASTIQANITAGGGDIPTSSSADHTSTFPYMAVLVLWSLLLLVL